MDEIIKIFNQLDSNQIKIENERPQSLIESSLINLNDYELYHFNNNYDYKDNIWFILYYLSNNIDDKTYIEQNRMFKENMMKLLEEFGKDKNLKLYDKKELSDSIKKFLNTGLSTKLYLSNLYKVNIYVLYINLDMCIKFGNNEDSYLLIYDNDKMNLYSNLEDSMCNIDDSIVVKYDDLKNYKKLKIGELRDLSEKLHIDLTKDDKKKTKALLINDVESFLENML